MRKTVEYAILAGLAHAPRSGYDLTKWLARVASHFWPVGHSSIYPALAALEAKGAVRHEAVPSEQGPERKVYSLTAQGTEELLAWTDGPLTATQIRDEQLVQALCYGFLPPERALARLGRVRRYHADRLAHYAELERRLREGQDAEGEGQAITGPAYVGTLLVVRCGFLSEQNSLRWCDEAMTIIAAAGAGIDDPGGPRQGGRHDE
jgi:DNA-binding PadR family transcriptional regulator